MQEKTISIILAGGAGSRLYPLTAERAKPAVPFGGRYRIIDFTLSNCLHSGLRRILVLTQCMSHSLQQHLRDGWSIYNSDLAEYHHAGSSTDADRPIVVQRDGRRDLPESVPDGERAARNKC